MKNIKNKVKVEVKGIHLISLFDMRSDRAMQLQKWIQEIERKRAITMQFPKDIRKERLLKLSAQFKTIKEELRKYLTQQYCVENITTTAGRVVSAKLLAGTYGSTGAVTHTAVGDDNTVAVVGNTVLGNETSRKALTDGNTSSNQTLLETFFSTSEAVDTHEEFGMFIDGTGAADSGELFNRFTQTVVKANTESMNVQSTISWNDA